MMQVKELIVALQEANPHKFVFIALPGNSASAQEIYQISTLADCVIIHLGNLEYTPMYGMI